MTETPNHSHEEARISPSLLAFLLCQDIRMNPDGTHTVEQVLDTLSVAGLPTVESLAQAGAALAPLTVSVFTFFGHGVGHFNSYLEIESQEEGSVTRTPEMDFWLSSQQRRHAIITRAELPVQADVFTFRLFLGGERVSEQRLRVDVTAGQVPNSSELPQA